MKGVLQLHSGSNTGFIQYFIVFKFTACTVLLEADGFWLPTGENVGLINAMFEKNF